MMNYNALSQNYIHKYKFVGYTGKYALVWSDKWKFAFFNIIFDVVMLGNRISDKTNHKWHKYTWILLLGWTTW